MFFFCIFSIVKELGGDQDHWEQNQETESKQW